MTHVTVSEAGDFDRFKDLLGPHHVDQQIRQAISFCWMSLQGERKNAAELETQIRRIVDRALRDFREDLEQLGATPSHPAGPKLP